MIKEKLRVFDTYPHNYGIIIPAKTGVFWEQQTEGVACNHVRIEGTFIPLAKPIRYVSKGMLPIQRQYPLKELHFRRAESPRLLIMGGCHPIQKMCKLPSERI